MSFMLLIGLVCFRIIRFRKFCSVGVYSYEATIKDSISFKLLPYSEYECFDKQ